MQRIGVLSAHVGAAPAPAAPPGPVCPDVKVVTILGGGNSGHVTAALVHENTGGRVQVKLLTQTPELWTKTPEVSFPDGSKQVGKVAVVTSRLAEALEDTDLVIWTGPVNQTKPMFEAIAPYINKKPVAVGTIFAQGLCHILALRTFGPQVRFFALRNIPWLCRVVTKGSASAIVGPKKSIEVCTMNLGAEWITQNLEPLFVVQKIGLWEPTIALCPDFTPIVFNPANQIIHPARYWGLFRQYQGKPLAGRHKPNQWLYRDMDEMSGQILQGLDDELQMCKDAYYNAVGAVGCQRVLPLRDRLLDQYGDQIHDKSTLAKMVGTNTAYSMAKTPVIESPDGVSPNAKHRVVQDDIGWGLCVLISIAERVRTPCTLMKMLVVWHQELMGKQYLVNGELVGRDCRDLVLLKPTDPLELVAYLPDQVVQLLVEQADEDRIGNP